MPADNDVPSELPTPLPLVITSDDAAHEGFFGSSDPTPDTPVGAAYLWWSALLNLPEYRNAVENLSYRPADWGDYQSTAALLEGWALMSFPLERDEPADDIAAVKFMRDTGHPMRAFGDAPLDEVMVLTLVLEADGWWRVWGLSQNHVPSNSRIRTGKD